MIIHYVKELPKKLKVTFTAMVDADSRISTARNHTATHLLHESLQEILGDHVQQKGSLVCSDYLRFDFSHFSKLSDDQTTKIEESVNHKILSNIYYKTSFGITYIDYILFTHKGFFILKIIKLGNVDISGSIKGKNWSVAKPHVKRYDMPNVKRYDINNPIIEKKRD